MNLQDIIDRLALEPLTRIRNAEVRGVFISDMLSDVMAGSKAGDLWMTVQTHKNIVSAANLVDISAIAITSGKKVPQETIELANRFHVNILATRLTTFQLTARLIEAGLRTY